MLLDNTEWRDALISSCTDAVGHHYVYAEFYMELTDILDSASYFHEDYCSGWPEPYEIGGAKDLLPLAHSGNKRGRSTGTCIKWSL